jgi:hypothetical protein
MSDLRQRAAEASATVTVQPGENPVQVVADSTTQPEPLEEIEYTGPIADVEVVPVAVAWIRVMRDVTSIDKKSVAKIQTDKGGYSFNYRGIDKVLNAVGPALRRHGVFVVPHRIEPEHNAAGRMRECTVTVTYRVYGPAGDYFETQGVGEGLDSGERATPKALTTSYRNMLIVALCIPTEDPKLDPDVVNLQREEPRPPTPIEYRDEILNARTTRTRMLQIMRELNAHPALGSAVVSGEDLDSQTTLLDLCTNTGQRRFGGAS